ncbi:MAG: EamA family transporter RarD [Alphaproteobacteria bacterium]|nr:EamA family transporter RarD [Alphaproteobacteria bacterium]
MTIVPNTSYSPEEVRAGLLAALAAYGVWGLLPLYLKGVGFADPREVLGVRILWSVPACFLGVVLISGWRRGMREIAGAMRPGLIGALALSATFIFFNWGLYVWAVATDRVLSAALAYFIAPLVQVALGVLLYGERMRALQWAALALAAAGVVAQGVALGAFPWVSILLCATWCAYGLVRKRTDVPAATGLLIETLILLLPAAGLLMWVGGEALTLTDGAGAFWLLALAGPLTAVPLALFAFGARRLNFSTIGLLQFIAPSLQFLVGAALGEPLGALRLASFGLIWAGLVVFCFDVWRRESAQAKAVT